MQKRTHHQQFSKNRVNSGSPFPSTDALYPSEQQTFVKFEKISDSDSPLLNLFSDRLINSARIPATCGVAIDVPESLA